MRSKSSLLAALVLAAIAFASPPVSLAADSTFVGVVAMLVDDEVARQLELSADVRKKLAELVDQREADALGLALEIKSLPAAEQQAKLAPFVAESEKLGLALLNETQHARLKQIRVAKDGLATLAEGDIISKLKLDDEQKTKVTELLAQQQRDLAASSSDQQRIVKAVYERRLAKLLTPEQKASWDQLAGLAPPSEAPVVEPAKPQADAEPAKSQLEADLAKPTTEPAKPQAEGNTAKPQTEGDPAKPTTEPAKPSSEGEPTKPAGETEPTKPAAPSEPVKPGLSGAPKFPSTSMPKDPSVKPVKSTDGKLRFNFRFAPWKEVLDWFSQQADLSLVCDAPPPGTFNYQDTRAYTPAEAVDLLNSVLLTKGYTLVRRERLLMVINLADGIPANLVARVTEADLDKRGEFELVSCLFTLDKLSPQDAEIEIKKLLGPQGSLVQLPKARQILVTETAGRLRTIRAVIQAVENPPPERNDPLHTYTLEHASSEEVMAIARQLLGIPDEKLSLPDGSLRIALDQTGKRFMVTGKPEMITKFEQVLKLIDVEGAAKGLPGVIETPQLEVHKVTASDPQAVLQVMQTLMAGQLDVRLAIDSKTGNLVALAKPSQHATIRATLEQMQRDGSQVEVITLRRVDPQLAVISINKLFGVSDDGKSSGGLKVEADPASRQLLVRGTVGQIEQVRTLLQKMGEGDADGAAGETANGSNIRFLPLTGPVASLVLDQAQTAWEVGHANKIRIVKHADMQSTVKPGERFPGNSPLERKDVPETETAPAPLPGPVEDRPFRVPGNSDIRRFEGSGTIVIPRGALPGPIPPRADPQPTPAKPPVKKAEPAKETKDSKATAVPRRVPIVLVGHKPVQVAQAPVLPLPGPAPVVKKVEPVAPGAGATPAPAAGQGPAPVHAQAEQKPSVKGAEIVIQEGPGGIIIASEDLEALDEFESLVNSLADRSLHAGPQYTVFYLKYAKAETAVALVQEIMGGASGGGEGGGGGGSLFGDIASAALGGQGGGGLFGSLLGGLGGGGGGDVTKVTGTGAVSLIADPRLNAIVVQANAKDLDTIEMLLKVVDQEASPEDVQTVARPRMIPVMHTTADEMAEVVKQIYAQRVTNVASAQPRQPSPDEFIRALRGGGGRGGSRQDRSKTEEQTTLSIGVDKRTNSLIVSAPEPLFLEVKALVEQLDQAGSEKEETMRVVSVKKANPELVQKALVSIGGDKVRSNISRVGGSSSGFGGGGRPGPAPVATASQGEVPQVFGQNADQLNEIRRRVEFFNSLQQGGYRGGAPGGGFPSGGGGDFRGGGDSGFRGGDGGRRGGGDRGGSSGDRGAIEFRGGDRGGSGDTFRFEVPARP